MPYSFRGLVFDPSSTNGEVHPPHPVYQQVTSGGPSHLQDLAAAAAPGGATAHRHAQVPARV
jgi:hypothetical protein